MNGLIPWRKKEKNQLGKAGGRKADWYDRFWGHPFDWMMEDSFFPLAQNPLGGPQNWWPDIDIREEKNKIKVEAEIPGMEKEDIQVYLEGRRLTIKGEKTQENESNKKGLFRKERVYGYFNRTVDLPAEVEADSVTAKYKRGVLKLDLKKAASEKRQAISVQTG